MKIKTNELTIKNKNKVLLSKVNIDITFNKLQIKGKNGVGKTSLFNEIYKGNNKIICSADKITYINQKLILLQKFSIIDNLKLLLNDYENAYKQFFSIFPTIDENTIVKKLSGGQKQILNIIVGINQNFDLLLIDEPFNNLDRKNKTYVNDLLSNIDKNIIIVSHGYKLDFVDKILIIKNKELYEQTKE